MDNHSNYVIGVDFGTDSVRSVLIDAGNGEEVSSAVHRFTRWEKGLYCDPGTNQFRQHPLDYIEGIEITIKKALELANGIDINRIKGLSIDTTGSTPVAVDEQGIPLSLKAGFEENPNAMFILWKDHTAVKEAEEINVLSRSWGGTDFTQFEGGVYSSEWFWAKVLHVIREDESVFQNAFSWVEHCDWMPALLTGKTDPLHIKRSRCAAGHKAMWHKDWDGLPDEEFLVQLDPKLQGIKSRLYTDTYTADTPIGNLSAEWAKKLGLHERVIIGAGTFDAHAGALGGEVEEYTLSKVMGTSTCDMLVAPLETAGEKLVKGICGQVDGSIIPGMLGLEAGQSAFGDIYAWYKDFLMWPAINILNSTHIVDTDTAEKLTEEISDKLIDRLSEEASEVPIDESGIIALDWMNGRRTPDANQALKGAIAGLTLGSDAPKVFRALVEATCFGSKKIVERFREEGIEIKNVVALGGVAKKSPFVMQVMADVLNMPIKVAYSEQTPALGAAMLATVVSGLYSDTKEAQKAMGNGFDTEYYPIEENVHVYDKLYHRYDRLGTFIENET